MNGFSWKFLHLAYVSVARKVDAYIIRAHVFYYEKKNRRRKKQRKNFQLFPHNVHCIRIWPKIIIIIVMRIVDCLNERIINFLMIYQKKINNHVKRKRALLLKQKIIRLMNLWRATQFSKKKKMKFSKKNGLNDPKF